MTKPVRIQLSRRKGWRMPPNTVKVDRTTKWGNPYIVGIHGTREECVKLFMILMAGQICLSMGKDEDGQYHADKQIAYYKHVRRNHRHLRGKNLACWCSLEDGQGNRIPCHADVLLEIANRPTAHKERK